MTVSYITKHQVAAENIWDGEQKTLLLPNLKQTEPNCKLQWTWQNALWYLQYCSSDLGQVVLKQAAVREAHTCEHCYWAFVALCLHLPAHPHMMYYLLQTGTLNLKWRNMQSDEMQQNNTNQALDDQIQLHPWNLPVHAPVRFLGPMHLPVHPQHNLFPTKNQENINCINFLCFVDRASQFSSCK